MVIETGQFFLTATASIHGGVDAEELARLGVDPAAVVDFSSNQSPLGASPRVAEAIAGAVVDAYPDRNALPLAAAIAAHHGLSPAQVVVGNGSTELIRLIAQLALRPRNKVLALYPTFGEYEVASRLARANYQSAYFAPNYKWEDVSSFPYLLTTDVRPKVFWWCSPNNPTGMAPRPEEISGLVRGNPQTLFVLDEAYCDLLPAPQWTSDLLECSNLIVLRSMTKAWGLAGLRLGYALGCEPLITELRAAKPPWNVNACAQAAGLAALTDTEHYVRTLTLLREQKDMLVSGLQERGWKVIPSAAAFFLVQVSDAPAVRLALLEDGCLVRDCTSFGLPEYIRISPRLPEQNRQLLTAFARLTPEGRAR